MVNGSNGGVVVVLVGECVCVSKAMFGRHSCAIRCVMCGCLPLCHNIVSFRGPQDELIAVRYKEAIRRTHLGIFLWFFLSYINTSPAFFCVCVCVVLC